MKALAEPKTKPHHGPRSTTTHHSLSPSPSPGPPRRGAINNHTSRSTHERSHSDTHAVPVDLSAESSSVTSLSKLHKSHTSGMLLEPAPSLYGTQHNSTTTPASVSFSLSFVHAAACSALIASVRKFSTTSNNILGTKPSSRSSTPITINPLRIKHIQREKKKAAFKSQKFSTSFDSSYSSYKTESPRNPTSFGASASLSPAPVTTRMKLKSMQRDNTFSRSLPTPAHSPKRVDAYSFSKDASKCQTSTPKKGAPVRGSQRGTVGLRKYGESFSYSVSTKDEKQEVALAPINKATSFNKNKITHTENLSSTQKDILDLSETAVVNHDSVSKASVLSPSKIGHLQKQKQGNCSSITIFQKIFRSKSEDILDAKKSPAKKTNTKKNIVDEVLTSPLLSPLIFRRSRSEDFLNKVIDRPEVKKYSVKDSKCLNTKEITSGKVKRPRISKPLRTFLPTDPPSIGETLKNKIKMSKIHSFNEDDACVPSRFFLEKSLSDESGKETTEKRYPTLQRPASNKETYFPASVKSSKHLRRNEPMRVYRVNQPKDVRDNSLIENCDIHYTQRGTKEDTEQTNVKSIDPNKGFNPHIPHPSIHSQTFSKKSPWFEKFQKSRVEVLKRKEEGNENDELNDSFGSSVHSSGSDDSIHEGYPKPLEMSQKSVLNTTYPQSKYVLTRYRGQPDVRRRVAEKLNAVIRELEEEMRMIHPGPTYPSDEENLYWNDPITNPYSTLPLPTDTGIHRPTSLPLRKYAVHRRNSAPMLSPIEEVKVSPTSADLESMTILQRSLAKCSSFNGDKLRRNNIPSYPQTKGNPKGMKLEIEEPRLSQKGSFKAQDPKHQDRSALILPPSETQPSSLVNPDPTSYCNQYGSENDVDYV